MIAQRSRFQLQALAHHERAKRRQPAQRENRYSNLDSFLLLQAEQEKSERLLLNILPGPIAQRLKILLQLLRALFNPLLFLG